MLGHMSILKRFQDFRCPQRSVTFRATGLEGRRCSHGFDSAIGLQPFRVLCQGPAVERFALALKLIERNRVPARIRNAIHPNMRESTSSRILENSFTNSA